FVLRLLLRLAVLGRVSALVELPRRRDRAGDVAARPPHLSTPPGLGACRLADRPRGDRAVRARGGGAPPRLRDPGRNRRDAGAPGRDARRLPLARRVARTLPASGRRDRPRGDRTCSKLALSTNSYPHIPHLGDAER